MLLGADLRLRCCLQTVAGVPRSTHLARLARLGKAAATAGLVRKASGLVSSPELSPDTNWRDVMTADASPLCIATLEQRHCML